MTSDLRKENETLKKLVQQERNKLFEVEGKYEDLVLELTELKKSLVPPSEPSTTPLK